MSESSDGPPQKTQLEETYGSERVRSLLQAANDSARLFRTVFVAFLVLTLYVLVLVVSANEELLFRDGGLQVPILNVEVRTSYYFIATPWIVLFLHLNLMLQAVFLVEKIEDYRRALYPNQQGEMIRLLFPVPLARVAGNRSTRAPLWLIKLIVFATLVILPFFTMGAIQTQFLRFQNLGYTSMHLLLLVLDWILIWRLWPQVRRLYSREESSHKRKVLGWRFFIHQLWWLCPSAMGIFFLAIAYIPQPLGPKTDNAEDWLQSAYYKVKDDWFRPWHILNVQKRRLYMQSEKTILDDECKKEMLGLDLTGRSYKYADLSDSFLCNAVLDGAIFQGATLVNVRLRSANLRGAQLQDANLRGAQLRGADLNKVRLRSANLRGAQLQDAYLIKAQLQKAILINAQLQRADLIDVRLRSANLRGAQLQDADLRGAQLQDADLRGAQLQGATLINAQLQGADLRGTSFSRANLTQAHLQGVNLGKTESQGAKTNFQGAKLTNISLQGAQSEVKDFENMKFDKRINDSIGKKSVLSGGDGLDGLDGDPGSYTLEEANQWITEYKKALRPYQ